MKYKQEYEMTKGKMIGVKTVSGDSQMAHSAKATKLQSELNYKKEYEDSKTKYSASLDMMNLTHAKKAQELATEKNYKTFLHEYTILPTDMKVEWAKKAYGLQSDVRVIPAFGLMTSKAKTGTNACCILHTTCILFGIMHQNVVFFTEKVSL